VSSCVNVCLCVEGGGRGVCVLWGGGGRGREECVCEREREEEMEEGRKSVCVRYAQTGRGTGPRPKFTNKKRIHCRPPPFKNPDKHTQEERTRGHEHEGQACFECSAGQGAKRGKILVVVAAYVESVAAHPVGIEEGGVVCMWGGELCV
jgi:hypothetical protein